MDVLSLNDIYLNKINVSLSLQLYSLDSKCENYLQNAYFQLYQHVRDTV